MDNKVAKLIKNLSFHLSYAVIALAGVMFVFVVDICLSSTKYSTVGWLFTGIMITLGAVICAIASEMQKEKPKLFYILKGASFLCLIAYLIFIYKFADSKLCTSIQTGEKWNLLTGFNNGKPVRKAFYKYKIRDLIISVSLVLSYISIVISGANIALNVINGVEE